jgi:hypothetical protein
LTRYTHTQPESELRLLLDKLKFELPTSRRRKSPLHPRAFVLPVVKTFHGRT